jgi:hypothetical protein
LPFIGPVMALATMPLASLVFMQATRELLAGRRVQPGLMLQPLRDPAQRRGLLQLGAVYAAATIGVMLLAHVADGGRFTAVATAVASEQVTPEMLGDPDARIRPAAAAAAAVAAVAAVLARAGAGVLARHAGRQGAVRELGRLLALRRRLHRLRPDVDGPPDRLRDRHAAGPWP